MNRADLSSAESPAWIGGVAASLEDAAAVAARLLGQSAQPLIAGLGVDVAGARAAIALAERIGGVVEHMHSAAMLRDLDCLRETGSMLTTPGEARMRADVLLLVGDRLHESWPALNERLLGLPARPDGTEIARRIVWLAPEAGARIAGFRGDIQMIAAGVGPSLAASLAVLRARVKNRPATQSSVPLGMLDTAAACLKSARFGLAIWTADSLGALEIEMLNGLVRDLNETTRFSTLPLAAPDNGCGVLAACGWMTGFPMRTGFGSGAPLHDPWRFDAARLVASGETDCVLWVSAFGEPPAEWLRAVNVVALCAPGTPIAVEPNVHIVVGRPGVDHDAVLHSADTGSLLAATAVARAPLPSVAEAIGRIAARVENARVGSC